MLLWELFIVFLRVNIFGYGGGPSIIPLAQVEVVEKYKWMTNQEFVETLAVGNSLPGPIATKMAAYIGYKIAGISGALVALFATVAPTAIAMILLIKALLKYQDTPQLKGAMQAVRPVIVVLMLDVAYSLSKGAFPGMQGWLIAIAAAVAIGIFNIHPALAIVVAMTYGFFALS